MDVIESFLILSDDFVVFFDLVFESTTLSFSDLPEMVFGLCFFIFLVNEAFGVEEFLIDISEMLFEDFFSLEISLMLFVDFFDNSAFFFDELIELFVLIIGELWDVVLILRVLSDGFLFFFVLKVLLIFFVFILFVVVIVVVVIWGVFHGVI